MLGLLPMACLGLNASLLRHQVDPYTVFLGDRRANWNFAANMDDWRQTGEVAVLAAVVGLAALGGVWIGTGLKHRGLARAWMVVGSLVLAMTQIGSWVRWSLMGSLPGGSSVPWSEAFGAGVLGIGAIATVALATPVGMAVGLVLAELRKIYVQMMVRMARRRRQR